MVKSLNLPLSFVGLCVLLYDSGMSGIGLHTYVDSNGEQSENSN